MFFVTQFNEPTHWGFMAFYLNDSQMQLGK